MYMYVQVHSSNDPNTSEQLHWNNKIFEEFIKKRHDNLYKFLEKTCVVG